jgi:hypothetical protein
LVCMGVTISSRIHSVRRNSRARGGLPVKEARCRDAFK